MTIPATELAGLVQPCPELAWAPDGREPRVSHPIVTGDLNCAGDEAYGARFTMAGRPGARVIIWVYPACLPGGFVVGWHWRLRCGGWASTGWGYHSRHVARLEDATDAALDAAVALALGEWEAFPGGIPACLFWDGVPW